MIEALGCPTLADSARPRQGQHAAVVQSQEVRSLSCQVERRLELVSPAAWAVRSAGDHVATQVEWCVGKERGL